MNDTGPNRLDPFEWKRVNYMGQNRVMPMRDGRIFSSDDATIHPKDVHIIGSATEAEINAHLGRVERAIDNEYDRVVVEPVRLWTNTSIPYVIDPAMPAETVIAIKQAVNEWNERTHFRFDYVSNGKHRIIFKPNPSGCSADMGMPRSGEVGEVRLALTCDKQSVIHEIGHVVGLQHQHQHLDRSKAIIIRDDSMAYIKGNYSKRLYGMTIHNLQPIASNPGDTFQYDIRSVMHYGSYPRNAVDLAQDLRSRRLPFFTERSGKEVERPTFGLTDKDIKLVARMYSLRTLSLLGIQ
ncbi:M12 family metallopeptidase [Lysobacter antibioticus]|uniref:M12 family metallopeptidase n=1 Tax=Lysobacter antibioticus TaxID=84531 RepID=UPI0014707DDE|nr:M12 family metallopeptidase [Lysobacter antibioticus]